MYERMRKRCGAARQRISLWANQKARPRYRQAPQPIRGEYSLRGACPAARVGIMLYTAVFFPRFPDLWQSLQLQSALKPSLVWTLKQTSRVIGEIRFFFVCVPLLMR